MKTPTRKDNGLLNVDEAAKLLGYHPQSIRDLTRLGKLPATKDGWRWSFSREVLTTLQKTANQIGLTVSQVYVVQKKALTGK